MKRERLEQILTALDHACKHATPATVDLLPGVVCSVLSTANRLPATDIARWIAAVGAHCVPTFLAPLLKRSPTRF